MGCEISKKEIQNYYIDLPTQSAPTILVYQVELLKNRGPCFLQKVGCKKNRVIVIQKEKVASSLFE